MEDMRPTIKSLQARVEEAYQVMHNEGQPHPTQVLEILRGVVQALGRVAEACPRLQGEQ
ncbi:hypothetical protein [Desulfoferula mesophila]|uniref:Uncharacterized protein n=1 Tax=Desulfoferula mesophila TaxID=3058419 RepID=A0AAU9E7Y2_9BACT|nr:hypothetical protein FAK_03290 [Desulfoferula mesophilus]